MYVCVRLVEGPCEKTAHIDFMHKSKFCKFQFCSNAIHFLISNCQPRRHGRYFVLIETVLDKNSKYNMHCTLKWMSFTQPYDIPLTFNCLMSRSLRTFLHLTLIHLSTYTLLVQWVSKVILDHAFKMTFLIAATVSAVCYI